MAAAREGIDAADTASRRFLSEIQRFPMLSAEEERDLARRWRDAGDRKAAEKLASSHMRLVVRIARDYGGYGLPLHDLIAEGNVGLVRALDGFDPDRGVRFATYAMWWIRSAIQEHALASWSLVRTGTTGSQKKLFFNLRRLKNRLQGPDRPGISNEVVAEIATTLNVPEHDVRMMNDRLAGGDQSLNAPLREETTEEWVDLLIDEEQQDPETIVLDQAESSHRRAMLAKALETLNDRERRILIRRRLADEPTTLENLSQEYGVSRERVRQIETRAFDKLCKAIVARKRPLTAANGREAAR